MGSTIFHLALSGLKANVFPAAYKFVKDNYRLVSDLMVSLNGNGGIPFHYRAKPSKTRTFREAEALFAEPM
jgi:hypothetical protein